MTETWYEFATNTTLHGLRNLVSTSSQVRRLIWALFLLGSISLYTWFLSKSIRTYIRNPEGSEISHQFPKDGIYFPDVTICNLNTFMKTKIDTGYDDERFYQLRLNLSVCGLIRGVSGNLTCGQALLCVYKRHGTALVDGCTDVIRSRVIDAVNSTDRPFVLREFFTRYGPDFASMLIKRSCKFSGQDATCSSDDWEPLVTDEGICYSFTKKARKVYYLGGRGGLSVVLDAQIDESTDSESNGFRVHVRARGAFVNRARGFNALPGSHTLVTLSPKKYKRLPYPYNSNCSELSLARYKVYTKDACHYDCINNGTLKTCGCHMMKTPGPPGVPACSIQDFGCMAKIEKMVRSTFCHCPVPCKTTHYDREVSYSSFPSKTVSKIIKNQNRFNKSDQYLRENLVYLQIGFSELSYQIDTQVPTYGAESLFGDIGGSMGLFLGCSVLTVVEFVEYFLAAVVKKFRKKPTGIEPNENNNANTQGCWAEMTMQQEK